MRPFGRQTPQNGGFLVAASDKSNHRNNRIAYLQAVSGSIVPRIIHDPLGTMT